MFDNKKIAFLASRTISSESVLRCYDWATEQKQLGLGRAPYKKLPIEFEIAVNEGLLFEIIKLTS